MLNNVILYGAGKRAQTELREFDRSNGTPVCFADADSNKWHTFIDELEVLPLDEAMQKYDDHVIYVTPMEKISIIGELIYEKKIDKRRILNKVEGTIVKGFFCRQLNEDIVSWGCGISSCCPTIHRQYNTPAEAAGYVGFEEGGEYDSLFEKHFNLRDKIIQALNNNEKTCCDGCPKLKFGFYIKEKQIKYLNYSGYGYCSFNCIYCSISNDNTRDTVLFPEIIKHLNGRNLNEENLFIYFICGEICNHPQKDEILDILQNYNSSIFTNAEFFDERIAQLIKKGCCYLLTSIDAGTKETFQKIKRRDCFEKVSHNIRLYGQYTQKNILKYIFLPGYNDNEEDVKGFIRLCTDANCKNVMITRNMFDKKNSLPERTFEMIRFMVDYANRHNIDTVICDDYFFPDEIAKINGGAGS